MVAIHFSCSTIKTQHHQLLPFKFFFLVFRAAKCKIAVMGSASRASLIVAASVGAVEALKDQVGLCRWNGALRSLHQHVKSKVGSISQASRTMSSSSINSRVVDEKAKRSEESLRTVMYLSCWGPNN